MKIQQNLSNIKYIHGETESTISLEELQRNLAQVLQVDNLNFLLGAGCSSLIENDREVGISSMSKLYDEFFNQHPDFTLLNKDVKDKCDSSLEKLLEIMQAIRAVATIDDIEPKIDEKIQVVQNFLKTKIIEALKSKSLIDLYKNFYSCTWHNNMVAPINIFTTNYDLFNELALEELSFTYNNGFTGVHNRVFNLSSYKYLYVENMNLKTKTWQPVSHFYNLIKLHGSISWFKNEGGDKIYEASLSSIEGSTNPLIIYPTPLKAQSTLLSPYSDLFRMLEIALSRPNTTLIVLGYSFSDDHINRIITNSLAFSSFRLVVFGQSSSILKLKELKNPRVNIIYSDDKIHYFKNLIEKVFPKGEPFLSPTLKGHSLLSQEKEGIADEQ